MFGNCNYWGVMGAQKGFRELRWALGRDAFRIILAAQKVFLLVRGGGYLHWGKQVPVAPRTAATSQTKDCSRTCRFFKKRSQVNLASESCKLKCSFRTKLLTKTNLYRKAHTFTSRDLTSRDFERRVLASRDF